jgi:hypothetical protein
MEDNVNKSIVYLERSSAVVVGNTDSVKQASAAGNLRTCRVCLQKFDSKTNSALSCIFHPESFSGETAQRWLAPGDTKGGSEVHYFYTCCGGGESSPGCCASLHKTWDDNTDDDWGRKPGMGIIK